MQNTCILSMFHVVNFSFIFHITTELKVTDKPKTASAFFCDSFGSDGPSVSHKATTN